MYLSPVAPDVLTAERQQKPRAPGSARTPEIEREIAFCAAACETHRFDLMSDNDWSKLLIEVGLGTVSPQDLL